MLNVIFSERNPFMLSVIMLNVVAPSKRTCLVSRTS
jgi:hypothetical protein